ncbi:hypothetical protein ACJJTC_000171 [Scirpophaga incertulas]
MSESNVSASIDTFRDQITALSATATQISGELRNPRIGKTLAQVADDRVLANSQDIEDVSFTVVSGRKWKNKKKRCNTLLTSSSEDAKGPGQCHRCQLYSHAARHCHAEYRCVNAREPIRHGRATTGAVQKPAHRAHVGRETLVHETHQAPAPTRTAVSFPALPKAVAQPVPARDPKQAPKAPQASQPLAGAPPLLASKPLANFRRSSRSTHRP